MCSFQVQLAGGYALHFASFMCFAGGYALQSPHGSTQTFQIWMGVNVVWETNQRGWRWWWSYDGDDGDDNDVWSCCLIKSTYCCDEDWVIIDTNDVHAGLFYLFFNDLFSCEHDLWWHDHAISTSLHALLPPSVCFSLPILQLSILCLYVCHCHVVSCIYL